MFEINYDNETIYEQLQTLQPLFFILKLNIPPPILPNDLSTLVNDDVRLIEDAVFEEALLDLLIDVDEPIEWCPPNDTLLSFWIPLILFAKLPKLMLLPLPLTRFTVDEDLPIVERDVDSVPKVLDNKFVTPRRVDWPTPFLPVIDLTPDVNVVTTSLIDETRILTEKVMVDEIVAAVLEVILDTISKIPATNVVTFPATQVTDSTTPLRITDNL